jgi:hypothetical protein
VNVVGEYDAGEYRCTVTEGGNILSNSYTLAISGGIALLTQRDRSPLAVHDHGNILTSTSNLNAGFYQVAIRCIGDNSNYGVWSDPDGRMPSAGFFQITSQNRGELLIAHFNSYRDYKNGLYKCVIGNEETYVGLYITKGVHIGAYRGTISNFQSIKVSSSTIRLSWEKLEKPTPRSIRTNGYFISYGIVGEDTKKNLILNRWSSTSVDLSNLQAGVEYEATVRGFDGDRFARKVSIPVESTKWTCAPETPPTPCPFSGPDPPTALTVTLLNPCTANLTWSAPTRKFGKNDVSKYIVTYYPIDMEGDVRMLMVNKPSVTISLNITRTTTVTVSVQAIDRLGSSSTEVERNITFFPKIESPDPPTALTVTLLNPCTANLTWSAPTRKFGKNDVSKYIVTYYPIDMEGDVRMLMVNKPSVTISFSVARTTTVTVSVQAIDRLGSSSTEVERNITFFPKIERLCLTITGNDSIEVSWTMNEGLTYRCSINNENPTMCTSPHVIITLLSEDCKVSVSAWRQDRKIEEVTDTVYKSCKEAGISRITRDINIEDGLVNFMWNSLGNVDRVMCKVDDGPAKQCNSSISLRVNEMYAGKHVFKVIPYCKSVKLECKARNFTSASGIPKDESCSRLMVYDVSVKHNEMSVSVDFKTSTPATCVCKMSLSSLTRRLNPCNSTAVFRQVTLKRLMKSKNPPEVTISCKSSDCFVKHLVQARIPF